MKVVGFSNKSLRLLYEEGATKGLPPDGIAKLRAMFAVLDRIRDVEDLSAWPFRMEAGEIVDMNLEDCH